MFNVEVELPISSRIFLIDVLKLLIAAFADAEFINRDCICAYNKSTWGIIFAKKFNQNSKSGFSKVCFMPAATKPVCCEREVSKLSQPVP